MTWILILLTTALGFLEYCCVQYLLQRALRISDNSAHLVLGGLVLFIFLLPIKLIWTAFIVTLFFTPMVLWLSIRFSRNR